MNKTAKWLIAVGIVILITFTAAFLINSYNKGDIGNKAEKVAADFSQQLEGTWTGKYQISGITFKEDGTTSLTMLGVALDGTYDDSFDLETEKHTLTLKYNTILGISVERKFEARLDEDKLRLTDVEHDMVELRYTRENTASDAENKTGADSKGTKVFNPGIDVYQKEILGKWTSTVNANSGYEFVDESTVSIKLLGVSYDGTYSMSFDEGTNQCLVKINYASVAGMKISNSYYVSIADNILTLKQMGANISTTYEKEQ